MVFWFDITFFRHFCPFPSLVFPVGSKHGPGTAHKPISECSYPVGVIKN